LPVNDTAMAGLQARAAVGTSHAAFAFVNGADHPRNAWNLLRAFYPAMRKTGITQFRFYDLRHTFVTRLIQADVDIYTVQKSGLWKTISMVLRYAHHQPERLRGGAEVLDRLRRKHTRMLALSVGVSSGGTPNSLKTGAPGWNRTSDPQLRRLMLYPTELRARA